MNRYEELNMETTFEKLGLRQHAAANSLDPAKRVGWAPSRMCGETRDLAPLLFAADANLLSTLVHGLVLVVRLGSTTIEVVTRAIGSLCQNNILGIVVNCAQKSELYSKYTYYHSYYYSKTE